MASQRSVAVWTHFRVVFLHLAVPQFELDSVPISPACDSRLTRLERRLKNALRIDAVSIQTPAKCAHQLIAPR